MNVFPVSKQLPFQGALSWSRYPARSPNHPLALRGLGRSLPCSKRRIDQQCLSLKPQVGPVGKDHLTCATTVVGTTYFEELSLTKLPHEPHKVGFLHPNDCGQGQAFQDVGVPSSAQMVRDSDPATRQTRKTSQW